MNPTTEGPLTTERLALIRQGLVDATADQTAPSLAPFVARTDSRWRHRWAWLVVTADGHPGMPPTAHQGTALTRRRAHAKARDAVEAFIAAQTGMDPRAMRLRGRVRASTVLAVWLFALMYGGFIGERFPGLVNRWWWALAVPALACIVVGAVWERRADGLEREAGASRGCPGCGRHHG